MQTRRKLIPYEEAENRIGFLPSLHPRPNSKNMRALIKASKERLQGIPSYQSLRFGFRGFIAPATVYALTGEPQWVDCQDPGWHRPLGGTTAQQKDVDVRFPVASNIYNSKENVRQAYLKVLNVAVPEVRKEDARREGGSHRTVEPSVESKRPHRANVLRSRGALRTSRRSGGTIHDGTTHGRGSQQD